MKMVIIEDEARTAHRLQKQLLSLSPQHEVIAILASAAEATEWLAAAPEVDVIFMDIDLGDGTSFDVLDEVEVKTPIIFTTAYDEYALEAFRVNSIDYLLKPIKIEELQRALEKLTHLTTAHTPAQSDLGKLLSMMRQPQTGYQQRFLVRTPQQIKAFEVSEIAYFYIASRITFMQLKSGSSYPIDFSLDQLEDKLDPSRFFRLNRQVTTSFEAIAQMIPYPKSKIKLLLAPETDFEVIVSSEKSAAFKAWVQG